MSSPIDLGISGSAASTAQSGGDVGGETVFDFGSEESQDGLGDTTSSEDATETPTSSAEGAGAGTIGSSSIFTLLLLGGAAVVAVLLLHHKK